MKSTLTISDIENFWHRLYFDINDGFIIAAIKRAYRDFNRTIKGMPPNEHERNLFRKKWIEYLKESLELFLQKDFSSQEEFDDWHQTICENLANVNEELTLTVGQT